MAFSATISWALSTALTSSLQEVTEPASTVVARSVAGDACVNNAWLVYIGQGNWIRDPIQPCKSEDRK